MDTLLVIMNSLMNMLYDNQPVHVIMRILDFTYKLDYQLFGYQERHEFFKSIQFTPPPSTLAAPPKSWSSYLTLGHTL